ncbi:MAG: dienelactone hydrolase family protein [Candidatus Rokubacteria bacterium]|nr:dienelactone hydrolase family protein [Candidatus Rokubacteria bacterium]MBI2878974.1 dienelactone hydrolase family protein [Candidatus Rokubacteria bacterium]
MRALTAVALALMFVGCAVAAPVHFPSRSDPVTLSGTLFRPEGDGPFPALVLLHTCAGVQLHVLEWAEWLKAQGYVALVVDSFSPRGVASVCGTGEVPVYAVARDAYSALVYLRSLPFVDADRIGLAGWSYGAMAALLGVREAFVKATAPKVSTFRAVIAFYPACEYFGPDTTLPVLLLLGDADTWTPPTVCVQVASRLQERGQTALAVVYPGAHHAFDRSDLGGRTVSVLGHTLRYDPAATADARSRVRSFLSEHLSRRR